MCHLRRLSQAQVWPGFEQGSDEIDEYLDRPRHAACRCTDSPYRIEPRLALRWCHALIRLTINRLYLRTPVFMASNFVLLAMWVILGAAILA